METLGVPVQECVDEWCETLHLRLLYNATTKVNANMSMN
jgi:hypothetical protein